MLVIGEIMVKFISDLEELKDLLTRKSFTIMIHLKKSDVEKWKEDGKFGFIKSQLENIYNLKFACTTLENGDCAYYFIAPTLDLKTRITSMLLLLTIDNRAQLTKIDPSKCVKMPYTSKYDQDFSPLQAEGTIKACPLF